MHSIMKKMRFSLPLLAILLLGSCGSSASSGNTHDTPSATAGSQPAEVASAPAAASEEGVVQLTKAVFLEKIYDFEKNPKQWVYKGDKPCIIDFYADWCKPCKMVAPIMAEMAEKYKGQIVIYKVNTDQERELAGFFGIRSIPTVFFCPVNGDPQMTQGALPKETYEKAINEVLLKK
jgi:thioredoxin